MPSECNLGKGHLTSPTGVAMRWEKGVRPKPRHGSWSSPMWPWTDQCLLPTGWYLKEQQHPALTLALPLQSLPIPCHPRPSGASTALLLRDSRSAPPDTTPGRGHCAGLLPRWKGMGNKPLPSPFLRVFWRGKVWGRIIQASPCLCRKRGSGACIRYRPLGP